MSENVNIKFEIGPVALVLIICSVLLSTGVWEPQKEKFLFIYWHLLTVTGTLLSVLKVIAFILIYSIVIGLFILLVVLAIGLLISLILYFLS